MRYLAFLSLRTRILMLVLLALVPALGLGLYSAATPRRLATESIWNDMRDTVHSIEAEHQQWIASAGLLAQVIAQLPAVREHDGTACSAFVASLLRRLKTHLVAFTPLAGGPEGPAAFISLDIPKAIAFAEVNRHLTYYALTLAFTCGLVLVIAWRGCWRAKAMSAGGRRILLAAAGAPDLYPVPGEPPSFLGETTLDELLRVAL